MGNEGSEDSKEGGEEVTAEGEGEIAGKGGKKEVEVARQEKE